MPSNQIKNIAKKSGKSVKTIERYWEEAKKSAAEQGHKEDWPYIVGIVQKMAGLNESVVAGDVTVGNPSLMKPVKAKKDKKGKVKWFEVVRETVEGRCERCGSQDAEEVDDPYQKEVHGTEEKVWLCQDCYKDLSMST